MDMIITFWCCLGTVRQVAINHSSWDLIVVSSTTLLPLLPPATPFVVVVGVSTTTSSLVCGFLEQTHTMIPQFGELDPPSVLHMLFFSCRCFAARDTTPNGHSALMIGSLTAPSQRTMWTPSRGYCCPSFPLP
ncbi:uncharacterized protein BDZ99DRAFT_286116 [Mytilinidion resinicola]|uniref:Uncharacterized protein n=1 Tax=Mytilinidion resinicola TaxID=574789 RepID=A0A6A6YRP2_9PEZI|nr:uncharacterized protein BDZ99DRAFT_286116 [Mytilinidion resinicola]KAF2810635.1 hypothetical protein BDZ99DRAFT_286116 [Mytilinidion resinicola]